MSRAARVSQLAYAGLLGLLPDEAALRIHYLRAQRRPLRLANPSLFTEKIQWLKLYDRDPLKIICADKLSVRDYVAKRLGSDYLISLLASVERPEDLDFSNFGQRYIVKTNHGSGGNVAVDGAQMWAQGHREALDYERIRRLMEDSLATDYSEIGREWEYSRIPRRILVEELVADDFGNTLLTDYKVHCFNGRAELVQMISDRAEGVKETWFDREWAKLPLYYFSPVAAVAPRPPHLSSLLKTAETLAAGFAYVRVDLYSSAGRILFGEMTFHPAGGFMRWRPKEWDERLGGLLMLPDRRGSASKREGEVLS